MATVGQDASNTTTPVKPIQRVILYKWVAPMRHFKKMDMKKYWTVLAVVLVLFVLLAILGQFYFMAAIASVMFLLYVIGTVPPVNVEHVITSIGIETLQNEYKWELLKDYFFSKRDDQFILNIDTSMKYPARLLMLVNPKDVEALYRLLSTRLVYLDMRKQSKTGKLIDGEWVNMLTEEENK